MVGHGTKWSRRDAAIAALLCEPTVEKAAIAAHLGVNTLRRWLKVPDFQNAYRDARRLAFGQAIANLQQASVMAVETLRTIMADASAPPSTRVRAADSVLNHARQGMEIEDLQVRIAALEKAAAEPSKEE